MLMFASAGSLMGSARVPRAVSARSASTGAGAGTGTGNGVRTSSNPLSTSFNSRQSSRKSLDGDNVIDMDADNTPVNTGQSLSQNRLQSSDLRTMRVNGKEQAPSSGERASLSYRERAADLANQALGFGSQAASGAYRAAGSAASAVYNAPGYAARQMGHTDGKIITGDQYSVKRGLQIADRKASNTGAQLGVPNLTGRSRNITNLDANTKATYENRFKKDGRISRENDLSFTDGDTGQMITTIKNNKGETLVTTKNTDNTISSEVYIPAKTYSNFAGRNIRSAYNAVATPEARQRLYEGAKESSVAMYNRAKTGASNLASGAYTMVRGKKAVEPVTYRKGQTSTDVTISQIRGNRFIDSNGKSYTMNENGIIKDASGNQYTKDNNVLSLTGTKVIEKSSIYDAALGSTDYQSIFE